MGNEALTNEVNAAERYCHSQNPEELSLHLDLSASTSGESDNESYKDKMQPDLLETATEHKESFNVQNEMQSLTFPARGAPAKRTTIATINIDGLRTSYKKESLRAMLRHLAFSIIIVTETHMLDEEAAAFTVRDYETVGKAGTSRHRGGVLILAHHTVSFKKLEKIPKPPRPIDICSFLLYPTHTEEWGIRITGIYIPPSAEATPGKLTTITGRDYQSETPRGDTYSHLIIGDVNPNCWKEKPGEKYHEWLAEDGLWELTDPALATYKTGSSLDKMILRPGNDVPEEWLPQSVVEEPYRSKAEIQEGDAPFYSAAVFPSRWIGDHHPVVIGLGYAEKQEQNETPKPTSRININDLEAETRSLKNESMEIYLSSVASKMHNAIKHRNPTRLLDLLKTGLDTVFKDNFRTKSANRSEESLSPFQLFCKRHIKHPDYPTMISAALSGKLHPASDIMRRMSRDSWRDFLKQISPLNTKAIFRYLAKEDGRISRANAHSCRDPLKDTDGALRFTGPEKCRLLADHIEEKLRKPAESAPKPSNTVGGNSPYSIVKANETQQPPNRKKKNKNNGKPRQNKAKIDGEFEKFSEVEIRKALGSMAKKKAAGHDGYVAEVYQHLPCLISPIKDLFDLILQTGCLPLDMLKLVIVPLDNQTETLSSVSRSAQLR